MMHQRICSRVCIMPRKAFKKPTDKAKAAQALKKKIPMIVLFYKDGCPACEAAKPVWDRFVSPYETLEIEEQAIPDEVLVGIRAFPTYAVSDKKGQRLHQGAITDVSTIKETLGLH